MPEGHGLWAWVVVTAVISYPPQMKPGKMVII